MKLSCALGLCSFCQWVIRKSYHVANAPWESLDMSQVLTSSEDYWHTVQRCLKARTLVVSRIEWTSFHELIAGKDGIIKNYRKESNISPLVYTGVPFSFPLKFSKDIRRFPSRVPLLNQKKNIYIYIYIRKYDIKYKRCLKLTSIVQVRYDEWKIFRLFVLVKKKYRWFILYYPRTEITQYSLETVDTSKENLVNAILMTSSTVVVDCTLHVLKDDPSLNTRKVFHRKTKQQNETELKNFQPTYLLLSKLECCHFSLHSEKSRWENYLVSRTVKYLLCFYEKNLPPLPRVLGLKKMQMHNLEWRKNISYFYSQKDHRLFITMGKL